MKRLTDWGRVAAPALLGAALLGALPALAQQTTGVPGSPEATTSSIGRFSNRRPLNQ